MLSFRYQILWPRRLSPFRLEPLGSPGRFPHTWASGWKSTEGLEENTRPVVLNKKRRSVSKTHHHNHYTKHFQHFWWLSLLVWANSPKSQKVSRSNSWLSPGGWRDCSHGLAVDAGSAHRRDARGANHPRGRVRGWRGCEMSNKND